MMRKLIAFMFVFLLLLVAVVHAQNPARTSFTSTAGAGSLTLAPAINPLHTSIAVQYLLFRSAAGSTATVTYVSNGITNSIGTKAVAATDRALAVTNVPWLFSGDRIQISSTDTNTFTVDVVWEEK